ALARHYGAGRVICIGSRPGTVRNARREAAAREMGADAVLYSADPEYKHTIADLTAGRVDAVIVTSPPQTLPAALEVAGYGAPVVTIGVDMGDRSCVTLDVDRLIFNKNSIIPVFAEPARMFPLSLKLIRNKVIDTDKLITHRFPIASPSALKDLFANDLGVIKAVMVTEAYAR
ncbi:MAG: zinc-binding dehydrogenase, partial [Clostridia bacterium]|nr:zinc-binding dehydrogenase [Clostridia bacterium]